MEERLTDRGYRVFIEADVVEAHYAPRVKRVGVDEGEDLFENSRQGSIHVQLALGLTRDAYIIVSVNQDLTLRKTIRRAGSKQHKCSRSSPECIGRISANHETASVKHLHGRPTGTGVTNHPASERLKESLVERSHGYAMQSDSFKGRGRFDQMFALVHLGERGSNFEFISQAADKGVKHFRLQISRS